MTEIVNIQPPEEEPESPGPDLVVVVLAIAFIFMTGVGLFLGNVFETYHNGSSL